MYIGLYRVYNSIRYEIQICKKKKKTNNNNYEMDAYVDYIIIIDYVLIGNSL